MTRRVAASHVLRFSPSTVPHWVRRRLAHELAYDPSAPFNTESLAIARLFEHANTPTRQRLWRLLAASPCACSICENARMKAKYEWLASARRRQRARRRKDGGA